ncbi:MAG: hypothetical protein NTU44_15105, partial [Bacteroidetes bacterium]|nr:hypothetical protein [Bacteroidota bacterium]
MKKSIFLLSICFAWIGLFAQTNVIIGTGTAGNKFPFGVSLGYERAGCIYTSSQIGHYGMITDLAWDVKQPLEDEMYVITKIYLKDTTATSLSETTWDALKAGATLVYDFDRGFTPAGWAN